MLEYREHTMQKFAGAIKKPAGFVCPLCQKKRKQLFLEYRDYQLFECLTCGLVSANVDFTMLGNTEVYDDPAYIKDTTREILDTFEYRKKTYAPERLRYILSKIKIPQRDINLLDVGCGPGYFLSHLKDQKIKSKGLELAQFLVDICQKKKLNVTNTDLADEPKDHYNVITFFDVLEHLTDPIAFFKLVHQATTPNGYAVAYTPNIHSIAYRLMEADQNTLLPFQHLCFFDTASLTYLAKQSGFEVFSIDYFGLDIMDYFAMREAKDNQDYFTPLKKFIPTIQALIDKQHLSNHMRIIFKKV